MASTQLSAKTTLDGGAYNQTSWSGTLNVGSVDLIAMVVSDAGLASTEPQWWNSSPLGCVLLGTQPRGGWQVMQRAVQWGPDYWARCFGVDCKMPEVYAYFACSMRNRLEVWRSGRFQSPMVEPEHVLEGETVGEPPEITADKSEDPEVKEKGLDEDPLARASATEPGQDATSTPQPPRSRFSATSRRLSQLSSRTLLRRTSSSQTKPGFESAKPWYTIDRGVKGTFAVKRPTKLLDGSRGGQAFMCQIFVPDEGIVYSLEEQARLQMLSVILVVAGAAHADNVAEFEEILRDDFGVGPNLGSVFRVLLPGLMVANALVIALTLSVFYALWRHNIYGRGTPYVLQICSLASWASGATGLLMLGGNPRVRIQGGKPASKEIQAVLSDLKGEYVKVNFGSLHGSKYRHDRGSCSVPNEILQAVCRWHFQLVRTYHWWVGMTWFSMFLLLSITLLIAGSKVAVLGSQIMAISLLVLTSMLRGAGLSGPEEWMIPRWKRRAGAEPAVALQGRRKSRVSATAT